MNFWINKVHEIAYITLMVENLFQKYIEIFIVTVGVFSLIFNLIYWIEV